MYVWERQRWDCESVLSLRTSMVSYAPSRLDAAPARAPRPGAPPAGPAIKLSARTGLPSGYAPRPARGAQEAGVGSRGPGVPEDDPAAHGSGARDGAAGAAGAPRARDESTEEKRARKAAVKEAQRQARSTKKALKGLYGAESSRQQRQQAGVGVVGATTLRIP